MGQVNIEKLRFPIGQFEKPSKIDQEHINQWINDILQFPSRLSEIVRSLTEAELEWKYRPGGWTICQVVHHCADSHMNSFIRFKLTLTENIPTIKPYFEDRWAEGPDSNNLEILDSVKILEGLHARWTILLKSLSTVDLKKTFMHPEHDKAIALEENIGIYAWHSNHHLAHIRQAIEFKGIFDGS